jgi:hypothetical protein
MFVGRTICLNNQMQNNDVINLYKKLKWQTIAKNKKCFNTTLQSAH